MTRHYVTTAAAAHLPQLRVLHASMRRHCSPFRLWVLAEGPEVEAWAAAQPEAACAPLARFLAQHPDLSPDRLPGAPRRPCELAWAWRWRYTADLVAFLGEPVTVLDVDLMFFSSPEPVFEEIGAAGAAFLPHAFPPASAGLPGANQESHGQWGVFNGGFSCWADQAPAERMAELCRQWSWAKHFRHPDGRLTYGEQGWLEVIAEEFGTDERDAKFASRVCGDRQHQGASDLDERPGEVPKSEGDGLSKVRSEGRDGLRALDDLRELPLGHGPGAERATHDRADQERDRIRARELPLGDVRGAAAQSEPRRSGDVQRRNDVPCRRVREGWDESQAGLEADEPVRMAVRAGDLRPGGDALGTRGPRRLIHVIEHPGAAPGPWNIHRHPLRAAHDGRVFFGGRPLVSFHFQSLRLGGQLADPPYALTAEQEAVLYRPYLAELNAAGA